ncbi:MAG: hypothetical protein HZA51_07520 [Planctomycetes bacterium]|nr:hypothetical protein [Planctomycetota bacterium]
MLGNSQWNGRIALAAALICALTPGCKPPGLGAKDTSAKHVEVQPSQPPTSEGNSIFDRPAQRLTVEFTLHRISAGKGTFTTDEGVWKLVAGPLANAEMSLRLAANGFRGAIGRESDRATLLAELSKLPDHRIALDHATPDATKLVNLDLGPPLPAMTLFSFDDAGVMEGHDYTGPSARFRMAYGLRPANLKEVMLELVPEIEEPPGPRRWVKPPDGPPREEEEERKTTFSALAFSARIPPGGFLLVGPTPTVHDLPVIARPFFVEELQSPTGDSVEIRESIYVISPLVRAYSQARSPEARGSGEPPSPIP